jgi:catechol 2,3-dioxygenase-like lactoylglutathione lyase family enzyme
MPTAKLDAFGVVVSDMARSLAFYRALGLTFPEGAESEGHVEATLPGGLRLLFDTEAVVRSFSEWSPPSGGHRMGMAFLCESPAEVDALYAELTGAGHAGLKPPWDAFWGQRYAQLADPDGNPVDLFAPL